MKKFDIEDKPQTGLYRKRTTVSLAHINEPFEVETQEGQIVISPETGDDWDDPTILPIRMMVASPMQSALPMCARIMKRVEIKKDD